MCDCKKKLIDLTEKHKWCNKQVRFETIVSDKPVETMLEIICCKNPTIEIIEPPPVVEIPTIEIIEPPPVVDVVMNDFINEVNDFFEDTKMIPETPRGDETSSEEDETVELTDISPEELIQQEEEEKRIRDELALIQLTKLTKKRVRTKK